MRLRILRVLCDRVIKFCKLCYIDHDYAVMYVRYLYEMLEYLIAYVDIPSMVKQDEI